MARRLLLRDAENISADMLQRILGMEVFPTAAVAGVGTGYAAGVIGKLTGVATTGHLAVTANGTTMVLTVLPGWAAVVRDAGGSTYDPRALFAESDANDSSITITANATGSTRNDTVCLKIDQNTAPTSDGSNLVSFVAIAGQSGGGLSNAPADGNLYLPLANVAVANGATSISTGNVTDVRTGVLDFAGELRLTPPGGAASKMPAGTLANPSTTTAQGSITTLTDLTSLSATVTVGAGRRIKITGKVKAVSSVTTDGIDLRIREGSTDLDICDGVGNATDSQVDLKAMAIVTPSAGAHTYKLSLERRAGTGTVTTSAAAATPCFLLIEDIGS